MADKGQVSRTRFLIHGDAGGQLGEIIPPISVIWPLQTASSPGSYNGTRVFLRCNVQNAESLLADCLSR